MQSQLPLTTAEFLIITGIFAVSTILVLVRHRKMLKNTPKWQIGGLFFLFYIIHILLTYFPENGHLWTSSFSWPIVVAYILTLLSDRNGIIGFLERYCTYCDEICQNPDTDNSEKEKATIIRTELYQIVSTLKAQYG